MKTSNCSAALLARLALLGVGIVSAPLPIRAAGFRAAVQADSPAAYYRFDDPAPNPGNQNSGSVGPAGNATNINLHAFPGAIIGSGNRSQFFDSTARTIIPWNPTLNPANDKPFTVEAWIYPASDQINVGQSVINNRYSYPGANRQGWVVFQRAQDLSYQGKPGYEGVGWNFRMYNENGGSSGLEVTSSLPFQIGKWTHMVVVYDPVNVTDATLTMYIDGVAAATNTWGGPGPGYVAADDNHPAAETVNGLAGMALGSYNNIQPGSNPYFGALDEFAIYLSKLSPAQILAHYQNATNAARTISYDALVQSDKPAAYLRLDELSPGPDIALNLGNLQASGVGKNTAPVKHPSPGALASERQDTAYSYHWRDGGGTTTDIPWIADNNPPESLPFTVEGWFRPTNDRQDPGPSPINNRYVKSGNRTGWVIYQRAPNATYTGVPGYSGVGWTFRMYHGSGGSGSDVLTGNDYKIGEWQHLVFTWEPTSDDGPATWSESWTGTLTAYVNGVKVASNENARYTANTNPTEDGTPASDLAVGSYNAASNFGEEFEGDIDELALYNSYILTPEQILAHYQAGTNSHPATNYATLVLTAAYDGSGTQRLMPATYLRLNDPAISPAANSGTLSDHADGSLLLASKQAAGPQLPNFPGFEVGNPSVVLDGLKSWASLDNPPGLNISGQIALEAWIKPGAAQSNSTARIISHGTPTLSAYLSGPPPETNGSVLLGSEVFLRIDNDGANYSVGSSDGVSSHGVSAPIPAADLGSSTWVHLVGTYDGANWKLYRNGTQIASAADSVGALTVDDGGWAIGSTGNGWADNYVGGIDEVAIYNHALSAERVQAHFDAASQIATTPVPLNIVRNGNQLTITWNGPGTLQSSAAVSGNYTDVPNAASPLSVSPSADAQFYRLRR